MQSIVLNTSIQNNPQPSKDWTEIRQGESGPSITLNESSNFFPLQFHTLILWLPFWAYAQPQKQLTLKYSSKDDSAFIAPSTNLE